MTNTYKLQQSINTIYSYDDPTQIINLIFEASNFINIAFCLLNTSGKTSIYEVFPKKIHDNIAFIKKARNQIAHNQENITLQKNLIACKKCSKEGMEYFNTVKTNILKIYIWTRRNKKLQKYFTVNSNGGTTYAI